MRKEAKGSSSSRPLPSHSIPFTYSRGNSPLRPQKTSLALTAAIRMHMKRSLSRAGMHPLNVFPDSMAARSRLFSSTATATAYGRIYHDARSLVRFSLRSFSRLMRSSNKYPISAARRRPSRRDSCRKSLGINQDSFFYRRRRGGGEEGSYRRAPRQILQLCRK